MSLLRTAAVSMCVFASSACVVPLDPPAGGGGGAPSAGGGVNGSGGGVGGTGGGAFGAGGGFHGGGGGTAGGFGGAGGDGVGGGGPAGDGGFCSGIDTVPTVVPVRQPPALSGGTMAVMSNGVAVVGDSDNDLIRFYDPSNAEHDLLLALGDEPGRVAEGEPGTAFVALRGAGVLVEVDTTDFLPLGRWIACPAPRGLAWSHAEQALYLACSDGELARFDFSQGSPTKTVTHPIDDLRDVAIVNGQLLVTTFRDANAWKIAADGTASLYGTPQPMWGITGGTFVPQVAWRTIATSTGLLMSFQQEVTSPIPDSIPCVVSAYGGADGGGLVSPGLTTIGSNGSSPIFLAGGPGFTFPAALPVDVASSADGHAVAVAYAGSNLVGTTDLTTGATSFYSTGAPPVSIAYRGSDLLVFTRGTGRLDRISASGSTFLLDGGSGVQTGDQLFHTATADGIACASCHPEGGDDGHVWQFSTGARRTPSLRGGLSGTEPFHWSGDESDISALMSDVFVVRMGGLNEPDDKVQALLGWLDSLPVRPPPADLDPAAVARGQSDFSSLGCDSCHAGAKGTDNSTVDVGTGGAFQVPRLVEMAYRAPFMHDGSAATLADRFTALGGANHLGSSGLTQQQIADLVAYLKSR